MSNRFAPTPPLSALVENIAAGPKLTDIGLPRLYSITEVCAIFNRHPRTIRAWRQAGSLQSVRVGKAIFFTETAILTAIGGIEELPALSV